MHMVMRTKKGCIKKTVVQMSLKGWWESSRLRLRAGHGDTRVGVSREKEQHKQRPWGKQT